jgi:hypothetical protein
MKLSWRSVGALVCLTLVVGFASPQDGLGKRRGGGGGGTSGGGSGGSGSGNSGGGNNSGGGGRVDTGGGRSNGGSSGGGSRSGGGSVGGGSRSGGGSNSGGSITFPPTNLQRDRGTNDPNRGQNQVGLGRAIRQSRSGTVHYGSSNNRAIDRTNFRIGRAQSGIFSQLDRRIQRSESRVGIVYGNYRGNNWGYRTGYCHWNNNWRDDNFWYPFYVFDPFSFNRFVCSPWYYYSFLPPYLNTTRIVVVNNYYNYQNFNGDRYEWRRPSNSDRYDRNRDLDFAIDDIVSAFEEGDRRAVNRMIPRSGSIAIFLDGRYNYSLNPDDFYDLFMDVMENSRTRRYIVEDVRTSGGVTRVTARHEYLDSWGAQQTVYHEYTLEQERGGYVIREFGTSNAR